MGRFVEALALSERVDVNVCIICLVGGFKYLLFSTRFSWRNDSQFDEHIFQMGWFNHQLVVLFGFLN